MPAFGEVMYWLFMFAMLLIMYIERPSNTKDYEDYEDDE